MSDALVPGCLGLLGVVEVVRVDELTEAPAIPLVVTLLMCAGLLARRIAPLPTAVFTALLFAAYPVIDRGQAESLIQALALLVAAYAVAAYATIRPAVVALVALVAAGAIRSLLMDYDLGSVVVNSMWAVLAWAVGRGIHERDRRTEMAQLAAAESERLRDASEREATLAERRRIARELHDVVAHAVTVIVVQARGGRRWIDSDPEEVRRALDAIEATGTEAINELRRMLALLDDPGDGAAPETVRSGPAELGALVERVRAAGLPVELEVTGEPSLRVASIDVSAYRVVQEALTNALRHGDKSPARVVVSYLPGGIDVRVDSAVGAASAPGTVGTGRGLVGLRERVRLTGGSLDIGIDDAGRFAIHAVLPFEGQPA